MAKGNGHGERLSGLTGSAAGLDAELKRYVELATAAVRVPLTSEKNIDRAARAIAEAAEAEKRVLAQVQALVEAITVAREAQQASTDALNTHATSVAQRRAELDGLLARFAQLGEVAKTMNAAIQKVAGYKQNPYDASAAAAETEEMKKALSQVEEGMTTVATHAQQLGAEATERSFEDLARQAESLRQQVLAAKNRLSLLQKTLPGSGGASA
jgi:argininosuccinate lyase